MASEQPVSYKDAGVDIDEADRAVARIKALAGETMGRGVLAGYSAAEVLGGSCGPPDAPACTSASASRMVAVPIPRRSEPVAVRTR